MLCICYLKHGEDPSSVLTHMSIPCPALKMHYFHTLKLTCYLGNKNQTQTCTAPWQSGFMVLSEAWM